jgi:DNA-binding NarL/FixJ family response regulator
MQAFSVRTRPPSTARGPAVADPPCCGWSARAAPTTRFADVLAIAESTAKTHVKRILAKVHARDRAQAVVFAYRSGLVRYQEG